MIQRQIYVRQRLCLDPLRRVHHQDRAIAGRQAPGHFIIKVNMSGGIDQIINIFFAVFCFVYNTDCLGLDGDPPFPLQFHIIQHLGLHLPAGQRAGLLDDPVRQGGFAVVDVGDNTKITDFALVN